MEDKIKGFGMLDIGKAGWIEKEAPQVGTLDAILEPIAVSPCTSDIHTVYHGTEELNFSGRILGHECVASVLEVGELVKDFKKGDKVIVPAGTPNWLSKEALSGISAHSDGLFGSLKFTLQQDGVFGEQFKVIQADSNLAHLPESVSVDSALMLTDMVATGFTAVEEAGIQFGDTVLVYGIGPVGLMAIAGAKLKGAGRIIGVGSRSKLIELADFYGATDILNYRKCDASEEVMKITNGLGVDKVILAGGNNDSLNIGFSLVKNGGTVSNVIYFSAEPDFKINPFALGVGMSNKAYKGSLTKGGRVWMEKLLELVKHGRIDPSQLVTHRLEGFDKIEQAFHLMHEKNDDLVKVAVYLKD